MTSKKILAAGLVVLIALSLWAATELENQDSETVLSEVSKILKAVEEIRGLQFEEQPEIIVLTKREARELFEPGKPDIDRMRLEEDVYKMSLLLPPDYPYVQEKVEQDLGWIAATVGDKIYIIRENFFGDVNTARRVIAHESVHVLQKQWFDAPYGGPTLDTTKAIQAAIEGDADLVADLYCNETGIPIHKITDLYTRDPVVGLGVFPYVFGDRFVEYLYRKGGWGLVNSMYQNLPNTTKAVMFPELYLENWTPVDVRENVEKLQENLSVKYSSSMGAYYVFLLYWSHNYSKDVAMDMARAWEGDWLIMGDLTENGTLARVLVWEVVFEDESHANSFAGLLRTLSSNNTYASFSIRQNGETVVLKSVKNLPEVKAYENKTEVNLPDLWG
ncbi:eCIS core domain-containing protein [Thermococcus waiotapuensis]|uniref:DUF4157 domain-containing protein n=1 Tax=Thermococcus waiotapuensis TaxID=90909 RepID=A0AAE4NSU1_9EURY|nr:DUF4157 domain-containing protein [Thermococcus waiotapuensis]MDV3102985.1 DUF4157 domain-containing protein [Thermococcus waiotapuensis]